MRPKLRTYLSLTLLFLATLPGLAQHYTVIDDTIINKYSAVTLIKYGSRSPFVTEDTLVLADASHFETGDTVMLYGVKGAKMPSEIIKPAAPLAPRNAGRYLIAQVRERLGDTILLNVKIDKGDPMEGTPPWSMTIFEDGEYFREQVQLIKVPSYRNAEVSEKGLTAKPWDQTQGTGGVLAMIVNGALRLDGDIDVSGKGFTGAKAHQGPEYGGQCSNADLVAYSDYHYEENMVFSGYKGESMLDAQAQDTLVRGRGAGLTGGGGGNGLFAGGGGGGNGGIGSKGGGEPCQSEGINLAGLEGAELDGVYYQKYSPSDPFSGKYIERVFMGGGGGSGVWMQGSESTDGGAGGGVVFIVADTIIGKGNSILSNGQSVTELATGAGGGGGAGGCVVLQVNNYKDLEVFTIGGNGGSVSDSPGRSYGGSGGGGVTWLSTSDIPAGLVISNDVALDGNGKRGSESKTFNGLVSPLRGFIFNPVPTMFARCSNAEPWLLDASPSSGGSGVDAHTYVWEDSSATSGQWDSITTGEDLLVPNLKENRWYRRLVYDPLFDDPDISYTITVEVQDSIVNNQIAADDVVCAGLAPDTFYTVGTEPTTGGLVGAVPGSKMNYTWFFQTYGSPEIDSLPLSQDSALVIPDTGLNVSTTFWRVATSGACKASSNTVYVDVLPKIMGNEVAHNDSICNETAPDSLYSLYELSGGDTTVNLPDRYKWQWQEGVILGPDTIWSLASGDSDKQGYQPPLLSDTTLYRRIVSSGGDACVDPSPAVIVLVYPDITNNMLLGVDQQLCQNDTAEALKATLPGGGDGQFFSYTWQMSRDKESWSVAEGKLSGDPAVATDFMPGIIEDTDTTYYRRLVASGSSELVCKDTSSIVRKITALHSITNNVITAADDRYCETESPDSLYSELLNTGEDRDPVYAWYRVDSESMPGDELGTKEFEDTVISNLLSPAEFDTDLDRWYRRLVTTGPDGECVDTSDNMIHLVVHKAIENDSIEAYQAICANDPGPEPRVLRGSTPMGETNTEQTTFYSWKRWELGQTEENDAVLAEDSTTGDFGEFYGALLLANRYVYRRLTAIGECSSSSDTMLVEVVQRPEASWRETETRSACAYDSVSLAVYLDTMTGPGIPRPPSLAPWEFIITGGIQDYSYTMTENDDSIRAVPIDNPPEGISEISKNYAIASISYDPEPDEEDDYFCTSLNEPDVLTFNVARTPVPVITADRTVMERVARAECGDLIELEVDLDGATSWQWTFIRGAEEMDKGIIEADPNSKVVMKDSAFFSLLMETEEGDLRPDTSTAFVSYLEATIGVCSRFDTVDLYFFEQPEPASAGVDTIVFLEPGLIIGAEPASAGYGKWTRHDLETAGIVYFGDPYNDTVKVEGLKMDEPNTYRWTVFNGILEDDGSTDTLCMSFYDQRIVTRAEVYTYDAFSPNDDLWNDYFIMRGLPFAEGTIEVAFFNSLGSLVRRISMEMEYNEDNPYPGGGLWMPGIEHGPVMGGGLNNDEMVVWDGLSDNGQPVPSGIYYYVIKYKVPEVPVPYEIAGTLELLREKR